MKITRISILTGKEHTMDLAVTEIQMNNYNMPGHLRANIQDIFPDLSKEDREFIVSGITPQEWNYMFKEESELSSPKDDNVIDINFVKAITNEQWSTLLKTDGTITSVEPVVKENGFTLIELYKLLDCQTIEVINLGNDTILIIDEEGTLAQNPIKNKIATQLFNEVFAPISQEQQNKELRATFGDDINIVNMPHPLGEENKHNLYGNVIYCRTEMLK